eukprot:scaffold6466_cov38-Attheya_sp.AAC.2
MVKGHSEYGSDKHSTEQTSNVRTYLDTNGDTLRKSFSDASYNWIHHGGLPAFGTIVDAHGDTVSQRKLQPWFRQIYRANKLIWDRCGHPWGHLMVILLLILPRIGSTESLSPSGHPSFIHTLVLPDFLPRLSLEPTWTPTGTPSPKGSSKHGSDKY